MTGQRGDRGTTASADALSHELPDSVPPLVRVRRWIRATLTNFPSDLLDDVLTVCTELVSNAYDHARGPRDIRVRLLPTGRTVRVEVDDGSPLKLPLMGTSSLGDFRGRGLILVDHMATRWGVFAHADRKTVWAEFTPG